MIGFRRRVDPEREDPAAVAGSGGRSFARRRRRSGFERARPAGDVGARAEGTALAGHHHCPHLVVGVDAIQHGDELAHGVRAERVEPVGARERDRGDVVDDLVAEVLERCSTHGLHLDPTV